MIQKHDFFLAVKLNYNKRKLNHKRNKSHCSGIIVLPSNEIRRDQTTSTVI